MTNSIKSQINHLVFAFFMLLFTSSCGLMGGDNNQDRAQASSQVRPPLTGVNTIDESGQTALHKAARLGKIDEVQDLIQQGVDVNIQDNDGQTALHSAIKEGNLEAIKVLVEQGNIDVNIGLSRPLSLAITLGDTEIINYLKNHGAAEFSKK